MSSCHTVSWMNVVLVPDVVSFAVFRFLSNLFTLELNGSSEKKSFFLLS